MKKLILFVLMLAFIGMIGVNAQNELIISENFQFWEATETTNPDTCWLGNIREYQNERVMDIITSSGLKEITVSLQMVVIMPECNSRRVQRATPPGSVENLPGVTTGWVELNKLTDEPYNTIETYEDSEDTIGEFIFGPVPQIDSIRFAHSATGGGRGIRIFYSTDGVDWENASPENEFWDCPDCQLGYVNTVSIFQSDVYIKFTSGFKQSDGTSQYSRLHNIDVWGKPGELKPGVGINNTNKNLFNIYPVPANDFVIIELASEPLNGELNIFDVTGKTVYSMDIDEQTFNIDISNFTSGIYSVQVTDNNQKYVKKLMVQ